MNPVSPVCGVTCVCVVRVCVHLHTRTHAHTHSCKVQMSRTCDGNGKNQVSRKLLPGRLKEDDWCGQENNILHSSRVALWITRKHSKSAIPAWLQF